MIWGKLE